VFRKLFLLLFLILVIFGCEEEESVDNNNEYLDFDFILQNDPINLSSNLNLPYFNDVTVGVKEFRTDYISLITASNNITVEISGNNIENLTDSKVLLKPPIPLNKTLPYANYIGVGQLVKLNGKYYGLYHGEIHNGSIGFNGVPGFYASVGLVSSEDGINFQVSENAVIPNYKYQIGNINSTGDGGYGEPSMLFSKDSTELFVYYVDHNRDNRGVNICMGKFDIINGIPQFDRFYFLDEQNNFTTDLIKAKEIVSGEFGFSDAIFPHVTYNKTLDLYMMVFNLNGSNGNVCNKDNSGIYITYSKDGINWINPLDSDVVSFIGSPQRLVYQCSIPFGSSFAWHPSLIYTNEEQTEGYLLYSYAKSLSYPGHQLYGIMFNIDLK
tara:strand:- start:106 stop:1251 length:1146 start_codon:yes stop_codon:yes gene_type:complete